MVADFALCCFCCDYVLLEVKGVVVDGCEITSKTLI